MRDTSRLVCEHGHSFDIARQGYVSLRTGSRTPVNADSAAMVTARERLLESGLYRPIRLHASHLVTTYAPATEQPIIIDLAGGTGYYLAGLLDSVQDARGICVDLSVAALRRAARSHPRAAAIGADLRERLPIASRCATVVTSFFGPRNAAEIRRVLADGGIVLVVTPTADHLIELAKPLGMLGVHEHKEEQLARSLLPLRRIAHEQLRFEATLAREEAADLVAMGPSAHHVSPGELEARIRTLDQATTVTVSVNLSVFAQI